MIKRLLAFLLLVSVMFTANAQTKTAPANQKAQTSSQAIDSILPVRGLANAAPSAK